MKQTESERMRHRFVSFDATELLKRMGAQNPGPALFLFTPVRDFLGAAAGGVVTLISPASMRQALIAQLGSIPDVMVEVSEAALVRHDSPIGAPVAGVAPAAATNEVTMSASVSGETVVAQMRLYGLEFVVKQHFSARLAEVRHRNRLLILFLCAGLLFLAASAFFLARVFIAPLEPLRGIVRSFGKGQYDIEKPQVAFLEFREFVDTLFSMSGEIRERIKERELLARRDADLKREQMVAELGALRNQINPHFLFNALNGINSMIDIDSGQARGMLQDLSDLFREILECSRLTTIPLSRESLIVERYLSLQKRRFGKRLDANLDLPTCNTSGLYVPALMIQTLVENAVKHGVERNRDGGTVTVCFSEDPTGGWTCTVRNSPKGTGARTHVEVVGTGTGLANTERRLNLLYGTRGWFRLHVEATGEASAAFWFSGDRID